MSHLAEVDLHVTDLQALSEACTALGLQFRENQRTHRWYGTFMGDSPLPAGFTVAELGQCEHAISVPGNSQAYEVGVLRRRDGKPGFALYYDNWLGGYGLEERIAFQEFGLPATRQSTPRPVTERAEVTA